MFWKRKRKRKRKMARHLCNQLVCDGDAKWAKGNWWSSSVALAHLHGHLTTNQKGRKESWNDRSIMLHVSSGRSPAHYYRFFSTMISSSLALDLDASTANWVWDSDESAQVIARGINILFPPSYGIKIKIYFLKKHALLSLSQSLYSIDADIHSWFIL